MFQILDYAQYYLDLARPKLHWRLEYNFTNLYPLPELAWHYHESRIHRSITSNQLSQLSQLISRNQSWFEAYFKANSVHFNHRLWPDELGQIGQIDCDLRCHRVQSCALTNVDYDDFRLCVTQAKALSANQSRPHCQSGMSLVIALFLVSMASSSM